jgi:hypothetical protein
MHHAWEEMKNMYKILFGKPEGKTTLGRPSRRWENNISIDFRNTVCEGVDWSHLAQDREQ